MSQNTFVGAIDAVVSIQMGVIWSVDHALFYNFKLQVHVYFSLKEIS